MASTRRTLYDSQNKHSQQGLDNTITIGVNLGIFGEMNFVNSKTLAETTTIHNKDNIMPISITRVISVAENIVITHLEANTTH